MANNRMTEGVGKKIVEALKMQTDLEFTPANEFEYNDNFEIEAETPTEDNVESDVIDFDDEDINVDQENTFIEEPSITETQIPQVNITTKEQFNSADVDDFDIPPNVAVLKQLISKLPTGVTKQTGAMIIRQTMEALGISMRSVLQEAQQVQEGLNISSRECQASILEYKKQIGLLEKQAQKYQRQYAALNEVISVFLQTNY